MAVMVSAWISSHARHMRVPVIKPSRRSANPVSRSAAISGSFKSEPKEKLSVRPVRMTAEVLASLSNDRAAAVSSRTNSSERALAALPRSKLTTDMRPCCFMLTYVMTPHVAPVPYQTSHLITLRPAGQGSAIVKPDLSPDRSPPSARHRVCAPVPSRPRCICSRAASRSCRRLCRSRPPRCRR